MKKKDELDLNAMIEDICADNEPAYKVNFLVAGFPHMPEISKFT